MKQCDTSSQKLIKNMVSLVASALVLVAATFAWFATGTETNVELISASVKSAFSVKYYTASVATQDVLWGMNDDGELFVKNTESGVETTLSEYVTDSFSDSAWIPMKDSAGIPLFPGEFRIFKLSFIAPMAHDYKIQLNLGSFICANPRAVAESIYSFGYCITEKEGSAPATVASTKKLAEILLNDDDTLNRYGSIVEVSTEEGDMVDVYFIVGIPGEDINNSHDAARLDGATVRIDSIMVAE